MDAEGRKLRCISNGRGTAMYRLLRGHFCKWLSTTMQRVNRFAQDSWNDLVARTCDGIKKKKTDSGFHQIGSEGLAPNKQSIIIMRLGSFYHILFDVSRDANTTLKFAYFFAPGTKNSKIWFC